jgi:hypothetical protein
MFTMQFKMSRWLSQLAKLITTSTEWNWLN